MMIKWDHKLSVGIEPLDLQHRCCIELINRIAEETDNPEQEYQKRLINELYKLTMLHFESEENHMYKICYPNLENHTKKHIELLEKLHGTMGLYLNDMIDGKEVIDFLSEWFCHHLAEEDKKLADFVSQQ